MIDSVDFWSIFRYPIIGELLRKEERYEGPFKEETEKLRLFFLHAPTAGYYEGQ
jgi:hypothetical protein